jgi:hypothetical protein
MVSNLQNFKEEESLLQSMGYLMGVIIDQKCPNVTVSLQEKV